MKFVDEFRDGELARRIAGRLAHAVEPGRRYNFMEFCGGHTHAISRYGVEDLLPEGVNMIHGPGCPVCVLPIGRIDNAIEIAGRPEVILCTYADTMRVPASERLSLMKAKARGADIRMVYSAADALKIARQNPQRDVVFFAIGFETTTPPTALAIREADRENLGNFFVFCNHVLTPAAIANILESPQVRDIGTVPLDGFVGPAHVSCVIGSQPYEYFAEEYQKPVVIAGFEPLDVMQAVLMLVTQVNEGRAEVENLQRAPHQAALRAIRRGSEVRDRVQVGAGQQGVRMRRDPARGEAAAGLQGVRHRLHAREPDRLVHGVLRRRLRGVLHVRQVPRCGQDDSPRRHEGHGEHGEVSE